MVIFSSLFHGFNHRVLFSYLARALAIRRFKREGLSSEDIESLFRREQRLFLRRLGSRELELSDVLRITRRYPAILRALEPKWDLVSVEPGEQWDQPRKGRTPLMMAAATQGPAVLNHLIARSDLLARDPEGRTPLMHLVLHPSQPGPLTKLSRRSIHALLATANAVDALGCTALMHAAYAGDAPSARLLLSHTSPIRDAQGRQAFDHALCGRLKGFFIPSGEVSDIDSSIHLSDPQDPRGLWDCVFALAQTPEQHTVAQFYFALRHNDVDKLSPLLRKNPQLAHHRLSDGEARTPLMRVASWGSRHLETLQFLLPYSDLHATDTNGMNAFALSLFTHRSDPAYPHGALFLRSASDLTVRFFYGDAGWTLLMLAAAQFHDVVVQDLAPICNPEALTADGRDALMIGVRGLNLSSLESLVRVCDPSRTNLDGLCALDLALEDGETRLRCSVVELLAPHSPPQAVRRALEKALQQGIDLPAHLPKTLACQERFQLSDLLHSVPADSSDAAERASHSVRVGLPTVATKVRRL